MSISRSTLDLHKRPSHDRLGRKPTSLVQATDSGRMKVVAEDLQGLVDTIGRYVNSDEEKMKEFKSKSRASLENERVLRAQKDTIDLNHGN